VNPFAGVRVGEASHPGPAARRARSVPVRDPSIDLRVERLGQPATQQRRARLLPTFERYVQRRGDDLGVLASAESATRISTLLADYGQTMYSEGQPRTNFAETINAVQKKWPQLRRRLREAWEVEDAWRLREPGHNRAPVPPILIRAVVALCLLWKWPAVAAVLLLGYDGCLRPNDMAMLVRRDLRFPEESGELTGSDDALYVTLQYGQTRNQTARVQHVRIANPALIQLASDLWRNVPPHTPLLQLGNSRRAEALSHRFRMLLQTLRVPTGERDGYTLAGVRAGGITSLYKAHGDLALVQWKARWTSLASLPNYLQEVETVRTFAALPPSTRADLSYLSGRLPALLAELDGRQY
jgi:hypothetical protein